MLIKDISNEEVRKFNLDMDNLCNWSIDKIHGKLRLHGEGRWDILINGKDGYDYVAYIKDGEFAPTWDVVCICKTLNSNTKED